MGDNLESGANEEMQKFLVIALWALGDQALLAAGVDRLTEAG